jgi:hypothetical protein
VGWQGQWKNPRRTKVEGIMINGLLFWLILLLVFYVAFIPWARALRGHWVTLSQSLKRRTG